MKTHPVYVWIRRYPAVSFYVFLLLVVAILWVAGPLR